VIDLFSRKVIGWSTSERLTTPLASDALKQAI
jgi:transposase InsO family protein